MSMQPNNVIARLGESYVYWYYIEFRENGEFHSQVGIPKKNLVMLFDRTQMSDNMIYIRDKNVLVKARRIL